MLDRNERWEAWSVRKNDECNALRSALADAVEKLRKQGVESIYDIEAVPDTPFLEVQAMEIITDN